MCVLLSCSAHCIPAPTGRQWMAVPPAQFPNMHTLPKDAFPKPYGKTDLPIVALWEFLLEALYYSSYEHILKWKNKQEGDFKIVNSSVSSESLRPCMHAPHALSEEAETRIHVCLCVCACMAYT